LGFNPNCPQSGSSLVGDADACSQQKAASEKELTAKAMREVSDKAVGRAPGKIRMAVKVPASLENRSQMERRYRHCPGRRRGAAGMDHQRRSIAMKRGIQQVNVRQHQDQRNDGQCAEQYYPGERTDLLMAHNTKKLLPQGWCCQPVFAAILATCCGGCHNLGG